MRYWLLKSEPETWSWRDQVMRGEKGEPWNGVRNYQANNNMKMMEIGDIGFFYHSVKEKKLVGTVKVIEKWRPDPTDEKGIFGMVTVQAVEELPAPVTLAQIKADHFFSDMALIRQSRLSVAPVTAPQYRKIREMAGL